MRHYCLEHVLNNWLVKDCQVNKMKITWGLGRTPVDWRLQLLRLQIAFNVSRQLFYNLHVKITVCYVVSALRCSCAWVNHKVIYKHVTVTIDNDFDAVGWSERVKTPNPLECALNWLLSFIEERRDRRNNVHNEPPKSESIIAPDTYNITD